MAYLIIWLLHSCCFPFHLLSYLFLELLYGQFSLEYSAYTFPPCLIEHLHLTLDLLLPLLTLKIDKINLALCVRQLLLQLSQLVFEMIVADEPRILAVLVQEL
jgi:hypothetical protein